MHFLGLAGMPRRIPDYPDVYWSWNYISSVGSLVSVVGVLVFFFTVWDVYFGNSLFLQVKNNYYVIVLNNLIGKNLNFSASKNTYTFIKYNFFNVYIFDTIYIYLDRFLLSLFINEFLFSNLWKLSTSDVVQAILDELKNKAYSKYFNIYDNFVSNSMTNDMNLIRLINFLIYGWISLFLVFFYSSKTLGFRYLKLNFHNLILNKFVSKSLPNQIFFILKSLILNEKYLIFKNKK